MEVLALLEQPSHCEYKSTPFSVACGVLLSSSYTVLHQSHHFLGLAWPDRGVQRLRILDVHRAPWSDMRRLRFWQSSHRLHRQPRRHGGLPLLSIQSGRRVRCKSSSAVHLAAPFANGYYHLQQSVNADYDFRWQSIGILASFCISNMILCYAIFYLFQIRGWAFKPEAAFGKLKSKLKRS